MDSSLVNMLGLSSSVRIAHIACYWKFSLCTIYKFSVSTGFSEQIMPILRILCYNGRLVTWTVVSLNTAKFRRLYFLWLASPCPIRRTCSFSWFRMTSACRPHNFVIKSHIYIYGRMQAVCKSRTGVHIGKFPVVRRTFLCRRCNFKWFFKLIWIPRYIASERMQQFLCSCLRIRCRGNMFTEPLSSNKHILWLHYSGLQASCHNIMQLLCF
jgi:hypothetical protein